MNKIAFEMWIIYCHWDFHGSFIRCNKIGNKLPIILCFQKKKKEKKNCTSNNHQAIEFWQNSLLQRDFFMSKSAWEYCQILYSIYTVYFVSYKIGLVQPPTFQQNFSVGCFLELSQKYVIFVVNLPKKFSFIYEWKYT